MWMRILTLLWRCPDGEGEGDGEGKGDGDAEGDGEYECPAREQPLCWHYCGNHAGADVHSIMHAMAAMQRLRLPCRRTVAPLSGATGSI